MIITIAQYKGGVGKTTSAIHFAAYFQQRGPTLLIDSDLNRSAVAWERFGPDKLPFKVIPENLGPRYAGQYETVIIDTRGREERAGVAELVESCDLLVMPTTPDGLAVDKLYEMINHLRDLKIDPGRYRVLITRVPPRPARDGELLHEQLTSDDVPLFQTMIREYKAYKKAAIEGVVVSAVDDLRAMDAWQDYTSACGEIKP